MTAISLPGQLEVPLVVDHSKRKGRPGEYLSYDEAGNEKWIPASGTSMGIPMDIQIAKLLQSYEERPSSETWSRIQALAKEILR